MRRIHVPALRVGDIDLPEAQAHHLRDVLRLEAGAEIQAFDAAGAVAKAIVVQVGAHGVKIRVEEIALPEAKRFHLTVAAAIPKAARADWMIEKLSELGTDVFVPLKTSRSVVLPGGQNKYERWTRLATESARQSGRVGVMRIEPLVELRELIKSSEKSAAVSSMIYLSTAAGSRSIFEWVEKLPPQMTILIGPEGGWSEEEIAELQKASIQGIQMTDTILRVETAAVLAAGILKCAGLK